MKLFSTVHRLVKSTCTATTIDRLCNTKSYNIGSTFRNLPQTEAYYLIYPDLICGISWKQTVIEGFGLSSDEDEGTRVNSQSEARGIGPSIGKGKQSMTILPSASVDEIGC